MYNCTACQLVQVCLTDDPAPSYITVCRAFWGQDVLLAGAHEQQNLFKFLCLRNSWLLIGQLSRNVIGRWLTTNLCIQVVVVTNYNSLTPVHLYEEYHGTDRVIITWVVIINIWLFNLGGGFVREFYLGVQLVSCEFLAADLLAELPEQLFANLVLLLLVASVWVTLWLTCNFYVINII
jgi:hypothetical protein